MTNSSAPTLPAAITVKERRIRLLFRVSLGLKAAFSLLEIGGSILAYFVSPEQIITFVTALTQEELSRDPQDFVAQYLVHAAGKLSLSSQHFAVLYLASHGAVKLILIIGLIRQRLAYYPLSIMVFALFVAYQLYRFHATHSIWLLLLTLFDIVIIVLTLQEYLYLRRNLRTRAPQSAKVSS